MSRAMPEKCEVCNTFPAAFGVGFPAWPNAIPGLPEHLRAQCLWVCYGRACDLAAQARAIRAAKAAGITLTKIWRHWRFDDRPAPQPERTHQ